MASQVSGLASRTAGAAYVLEGTLRAAGKQLRLSMRLGDTRSGKQVWGEIFTRDVKDRLLDGLRNAGVEL